MSAQPDIPVPANPADPSSARPQPVTAKLHHEPLWAQRLKLVVFVLFCVELGLLLIILPWTPVWNHNSLLTAHMELRALFQHNFTRGAVTGFGLVDIWIGIWSAVQYRENQ